MTNIEPVPVRNSQVLGVFDDILHNPRSRHEAVEIAGRGIAAEARVAISELAGKEKRFDDEDPEARMRRIRASSQQYDALMTIVEDLIEVWSIWQSDDCDHVEFEQALRDIVARLEAWPVAA